MTNYLTHLFNNHFQPHTLTFLKCQHRKHKLLEVISNQHNKGIRIFCLLVVLFFACPISAQTTEDLRQKINQIIATKKADVGISILGLEQEDTLSINGNKRYPMISVFKFHIALTVLNKVDKGELSLRQKLFIKQSELLENTWSPFKKKHPNGNVTITLKEALQWMVSYSDNNLCDILIRLIGGTETVAIFIDNYPDFIIKNNEEGMHENWDAQFINTTTPLFTTSLLQKLYEQKILNKKSTAFLYKAMVQTSVGLNRIKGKLPANTEVAHRTGSSFTNEEGLTGAINDIGIIKLPNGKHFIIAVYVHNTIEKFEAGEEIIADIAKVTWNYFENKKK
jgi:beta-lactamase class A